MTFIKGLSFNTSSSFFVSENSCAPRLPYIFHRSNLKMVPKYTVRVRLLAAATIKLFQVPIMGRVQK